MNEIIKTFFIDNATQIWMIISVIVGGFVTYLSTTCVENRKIKRHFQQKKLEEVLIPYCTCLEETRESAFLPRITKAQYVEFFDTYFKSLQKPQEYLKASRRVYLPPHHRKDLEHYIALIVQFEEILDKEASDYINSYKNHIESTLKNFPGQSKADCISINFNSIVRYIVQYFILSQKMIPLQDEINHIGFYYGTETNCPICDEISLNSSVRNFIDQIDFDLYAIEDFLPDAEDETIRMYQNSYNMLSYLREARSNELVFLNQNLKKLESPRLYFQTIDLLHSMTSSLTKTIDNIAF